ncbi:hypothetical protein [Paenibacillus sacheonensis]|uniref:Alpha-galactosidase n=1 Tax=Paenibacillus sacheonensis TaxID=742054 RepID=A0A7X4YVX1_9BACL|nr:hypothetical protein [Paenibacillus sacheonensis]MBM7568846.1 hypothetical protein [Paenibacillus sacheonensis]NBC72549.1 hypothetical protein [Paenibacillus sacheonensis]
MVSGTETTVLTGTAAGMKLEWDIAKDEARLLTSGPDAGGRTVWTGSLLPAFELEADGTNLYVKATAAIAVLGENGDWQIALDFGEHGSGVLTCDLPAWGFRVKHLELGWLRIPRIVSMQFGTRPLTPAECRRTPSAACVHWPDWAAEGYCVPAAGSSPTHSFWRSWDMGNARLPLGSFGDAMGTPYAAAFPRPLYAAAMGGRHGWLAFGPGEVPDAPLTLQLRSSTASMHYAYREDLWGPGTAAKRVWAEPLRLAWGGTGYDALGALFDSFGPFETKSPRHLRSFLCTWGDFKEGRFDLKRFVQRVSGATPADMVILDDSWETFVGSAEPDYALFPDFDNDLANIREHGFELAFWQSVGWTDDPAAQGLTKDDLLCGPDGEPREWRWSGSPFGGKFHYLLDPSSERTRRLVTARTERLVKRWKPAALKLDFGYGFPGPDAAVPRDPAFRGERLAYSLLKLVHDAAKSVDPNVTIIYYGIHPLMRAVSDLVSIDDLGDAGDSAAHEIAGHNQRCLWASLAARHGMAVNTSTGYYWKALGSILLDTAVVGVNGLTLGETDNDGHRMEAADRNRWTALQSWHRRTCGWKPLWLDADPGSLKGEPCLVSWGRLEAEPVGAHPHSAGLNAVTPVDATQKVIRPEGAGPDARLDGSAASRLTALALRCEGETAVSYPVAGSVSFTGRWALIAQDDRDLADSARVACIPFAAGELRLDRPFSRVHVYAAEGGKLRLERTIAAADLPERKLIATESELDSIAGFLIEE